MLDNFFTERYNWIMYHYAMMVYCRSVRAAAKRTQRKRFVFRHIFGGFYTIYYNAFARKSKAQRKQKSKRSKNSIFIDEKIYSVNR